MWLIFSLLLGTVSIYATTNDCFYNQEYSECNANCDQYCNWSNGTVMRPPCSDSCQAGCICQEDYVRQAPGPGFSYCIPKSKCISCPANEHYSLCKYHCQKNCNNIYRSLPCTRICVPGCVCNVGYVRKEDNDSPCIPVQECSN